MDSWTKPRILGRNRVRSGLGQQNQRLQPLGGIFGLIGCILSCPPVVGGLRPRGLALETVLIDKNRQNQRLQPLGGILGLIGCSLSCPPVVGDLGGPWVAMPPRGKGSAPQRCENDATDEPEDAAKRLHIDSVEFYRSKRSPKRALEAQALSPQGGRRECSQ